MQVNIHVQAAKGALKMGLLDSADRYLRLAQNKRKLGLSLFENQPEIHIS